jgi:hypothetical protein
MFADAPNMLSRSRFCDGLPVYASLAPCFSFLESDFAFWDADSANAAALRSSISESPILLIVCWVCSIAALFLR